MNFAERPILKHVSEPNPKFHSYQVDFVSCYTFHRQLDVITEGWLPKFYFNSDITKYKKSLTPLFCLSHPKSIFWEKIIGSTKWSACFQVNFENGFLCLVYSLFRKAKLWRKHCNILSCNKWAVLEDKCNFMSMRLNIYFPDDLVYLCSFPHWAFSFCASLHLQAFCSPVLSVFCDVTKKQRVWGQIFHYIPQQECRGT